MESEKWNYILVAEGNINTPTVYHNSLSESMPVEDRWYFQNLSDAMKQLLLFDRLELDINPARTQGRSPKTYHAIRIVDGHTNSTQIDVAYFNSKEGARAGLQAGVYARIFIDLAVFAAQCDIDLELQELIYPGTTVMRLAFYPPGPDGAMQITPEKLELSRQLHDVILTVEARWKYCHRVVEHQMPTGKAAIPDLIINSHYHYFDIALPLRAVLLTGTHQLAYGAVSGALKNVRMVQTSAVFDTDMQPQFNMKYSFDNADKDGPKLQGVHCKFDRDVNTVTQEAHIDLSDIQPAGTGKELQMFKYHRDLGIFYTRVGMQVLQIHLEEIKPALPDRLFQRYLIELQWSQDTQVRNDQRYQYSDQPAAVKALLNVQDPLFDRKFMTEKGSDVYLLQATLIDTTDNKYVAAKYITLSSDPRLAGCVILAVHPEKMPPDVFDVVQHYTATHLSKTYALRVVSKFKVQPRRRGGDGHSNKL